MIFALRKKVKSLHSSALGRKRSPERTDEQRAAEALVTEPPSKLVWYLNFESTFADELTKKLIETRRFDVMVLSMQNIVHKKYVDIFSKEIAERGTVHQIIEAYEVIHPTVLTEVLLARGKVREVLKRSDSINFSYESLRLLIDAVLTTNKNMLFDLLDSAVCQGEEAQMRIVYEIVRRGTVTLALRALKSRMLCDPAANILGLLIAEKGTKRQVRKTAELLQYSEHARQDVLHVFEKRK